MDLKAKRNLLKFLFIIYIIFLINVLFLSHYWGRTTYFGRGVNIIPFKSIKMYFNYMNNGLGLRSFIINIFGNIIVFIPLGYFYKSLSKRKISFIKVFEFALIIPLFVEIIQYISLTGSFDIDDIILNATGILIGFLSGRRLIK